MIDNIILLITGTLHQRPISELIPKCHPLGSFEQMEAIHIAGVCVLALVCVCVHVFVRTLYVTTCIGLDLVGFIHINARQCTQKDNNPS